MRRGAPATPSPGPIPRTGVRLPHDSRRWPRANCAAPRSNALFARSSAPTRRIRKPTCVWDTSCSNPAAAETRSRGLPRRSPSHVPSVDAHLGRAACETGAKNIAAAERTLGEAQHAEPDNPVVSANLGSAPLRQRPARRRHSSSSARAEPRPRPPPGQVRPGHRVRPDRQAPRIRPRGPGTAPPAAAGRPSATRSRAASGRRQAAPVIGLPRRFPDIQDFVNQNFGSVHSKIGTFNMLQLEFVPFAVVRHLLPLFVTAP